MVRNTREVRREGWEGKVGVRCEVMDGKEVKREGWEEIQHKNEVWASKRRVGAERRGVNGGRER